MAPHPIGKQEIGAVVLASPAVAAVDAIGIAVPFRHRQFVVGKHDQRLSALEPIGERIDRQVEPRRIDDGPFDQIHRNLAQRPHRLFAIEFARAASDGIDEVPKRVPLKPKHNGPQLGVTSYIMVARAMKLMVALAYVMYLTHL